MQLLDLFYNLRIQDIVDILFLTIVAYHLYLWFWGTKAFKALIGLLALGIVFTISKALGLFLTTWVFQILWQVLVFLLIILFQKEIRQVLERVNPLKLIDYRDYHPEEWVQNLVNGSILLARKKIGALIIIERLDRIDELLSSGVEIEASPSPEILMSIFNKSSPLHDGAVLIRNGQIVKASCYLPLTAKEDLPQKLGTRHRAAIGLSERSDAWIIVISEERGEISIAKNGKIIPIDNLSSLSSIIRKALIPPKESEKGLIARISSLFIRRWQVKLGTLALVSLVWLMLAGQQDFQATFTLPLHIKNIPENLELIEPQRPLIHITVRGLRKDASTLSERNVQAELDVSLAKLGRRTFRITRDNILLPNDRINIIKIDPSKLILKFKEKK